MKKKILLTGADGFVGSFLADYLKEDYQVIKMSRQKKHSDKSGYFVADLCDEFIDLTPIAPIDIVVHLAAKAHDLSELRETDDYFKINTEGTKKLLKASQKIGVRKFVYFSSVKAIGESSEVEQNETTLCNPPSPYGKSKLKAENLVLNGNYVKEPVVLRPVMIYGATKKGNLPKMIQAIKKGFFIPLPDTNNKRSMISIEDLLVATKIAIESEKATGNTYILTELKPYSTGEIVDIIYKGLNKKKPPFVLPNCLLKLLAKTGDLISFFIGKRFFFDSNSLEKLLGSAFYSGLKAQEELGFVAKNNLKTRFEKIRDYLIS